MSDFTTAFAKEAERRLATTQEKQNGFPCGPAEQSLFNGLFYQLQRELQSIHTAGGIAGTDETFDTTLLNIQALIDASTGGGDTEGYLLLSQARSRLPFFGEILTSDSKLSVTSPANGGVRVPSSVDLLHRGIHVVTTVQEDFTTTPSSIYHLRWSPDNGFELKDLSDSGYNPSSVSEDDSGFDSKFDDMLISRVITNSSNVVTITNLVNKNDLKFSEISDRTGITTDVSGTATIAGSGQTLDWSRTPITPVAALTYIDNSSIGLNDTQGFIQRLGFMDGVQSNRYGVDDLIIYYKDKINSAANIVYTLSGSA